MAFLDIPPKLHDQVVCSISAAIKYEIPANILLAISDKEGGKPGQWVRNSNGTYDVGSLQFNTQYLKTLSQYGIAPSDLAQAGCYPFELAAWRIRQHIRKDSGDMWTRVANYHSRTPRFNGIYRADLIKRAARWADWLEHRFVVYDTAGKKTIASGQFTRTEASWTVAGLWLACRASIGWPAPSVGLLGAQRRAWGCWNGTCCRGFPSCGYSSLQSLGRL